MHPLPPRPPSRGFGDGAPTQRIGALSSSQDAAAGLRERAVMQMAYEDAWKACNPDFQTPFASVEDAVGRLLPYHVFADYDEDDDVGEVMEDRTMDMVSEFEKQVLAFNLLARGRADGGLRGEELYMVERNLFRDERVRLEHARAVIFQQEKQRQEEAARARMARAQAEAQARGQALAQAQAQAAGVWQMAQTQAQAQAQADAQAAGVWQMAQAQAEAEAQDAGVWQMAQAQAEARAAGVWQMAQAQQEHGNPWQQTMAGGEGFPGVAGQTAAPSLSMLPQHDPAAARALLMMQHQQLLQLLQQRQHQQLLQQQQHQHQLQQQQQQLGMGAWPAFVAPGGEGNSSGQDGPPAAGQTTTNGAAAASRTTQQWWQNASPNEQQ